jgi:hypothetical protein
VGVAWVELACSVEGLAYAVAASLHILCFRIRYALPVLVFVSQEKVELV